MRAITKIGGLVLVKKIENICDFESQLNQLGTNLCNHFNLVYFKAWIWTHNCQTWYFLTSQHHSCVILELFLQDSKLIEIINNFIFWKWEFYCLFIGIWMRSNFSTIKNFRLDSENSRTREFVRTKNKIPVKLVKS